MPALWKLTGTELRLFLREPITVVFTLALPLMVLYVLGGVFGNESEIPVAPGEPVPYRGFGPTTWYTPAYVAVAISGFTLISEPAHLVEYREIGVLRRLRASAVTKGMVLGSQFLVAMLIASVGAVFLLVVALTSTDVDPPVNWWLFSLAFAGTAVALALLGLALGTLMPTARAAQSVGLVLWFLFLMICGAGPPPEVLPDTLRTIGQWLPLAPMIEMLQEPWLTGDWAWWSSLIVAGIAAASAGFAWWRFRWE